MRLWLAVFALSCHTVRAAPLVAACGSQGLQCGSIEVPENRSRAGGPNIAVAFVVVPALGPRTLPPLYDFAGGPGISATAGADFWLTQGAIHRRHRDVVLIDQRGTGKSAPLDCPELVIGDPREEAFADAAVAACRARLRADLAHYSTAEAVADVDAVRSALGHDRIDVSGLSYGTRVAQEYLRAHPDRVRAMALLGALSPLEKLPLSFAPNAQAILDKLVRECAADAACHAAIPDLPADIAAIEADGAFWEAVRAQLTTTTGQRRLPWLLHQAARGNQRPILDAMQPHPDGSSNALLLAVECPEDTLSITDGERRGATSTVFGDYRVTRQMAACKAWGVAPAALSHRSFVHSDVPVLLLSGSMDHVTPPRWAAEIAQHLPHAQLLSIPELGHFPAGLSNMECYDSLIAQFFETGKADPACIARMQPPPFTTGRDL